jgi:hypothetical protein
MTKKTKKALIKIAHSYKVKCRFSNKIKIPYSDARFGKIYLSNNDEMTHRVMLSDFFHELGHVVDFRKGLYKAYYKDFPTNKELRRWALAAEIHTDFTGNKLMEKHWPSVKFAYTYKYKKWQKFLREYWEID